MKRCFRFIVGIFLIAFLFSCNLSQVEDFTVGEGFIDSGAGVVLIDTMNIQTSTIRFDSIITNGLTRILVGGYKNSSTGTVTCIPHLDITSGSFTITDTDLLYDSLVVRMVYDGYYIGDTTKQITFDIKKVSEVLKLRDDGYLYNTSSFDLADGNIGQASFYPRPHTTKDFNIRLKDELGKDLFYKIMHKNDTVSTSSYFKEYFKGMAFVSAENQNQNAVGFSHDSLSVRVYYHEILKTSESKVKTYFTFPVDAAGVWYNKISHNPAGSLLENIAQSKNDLPSSLTSDQIMLQSGSGIYAKIKIPTINMLKGYGKNVAFIASAIKITPLVGSYSDMNPLPDSLTVYVADRKNRITSQLKSTTGYIYANKVTPADFSKPPYYEINITPFFTSEMANLTTNDNSLLIGSVASKAGISVNPFVFAAGDSQSKIVKMQVYCYIDKSN